MSSTDPETVVVIPARGGSKAVPRKNLRRVGGIPLVARAITSSLGAAAVDRVVVSTDDSEIATVAREWGAEVIDRPAGLADDTASSESVVLHALDRLSDEGIEVGVIALVQATSPFIDSYDLDAAIARIARRDCDCVFSAVESWGFLWRHDPAGGIGVNHDPRVRPRRQDRESEFLETGAFYVMDAAGFRAAGHRFFGRVGIALVPQSTALEIDTEEQLALASAVANLMGPLDAIDVDAVVTDFDGVHTDNTALVGEAGEELVRISRADGLGVSMLRAARIPTLILSTETNPVVTARGRKLGVDVIQGRSDKAAALVDWAREYGIPLDRIAYLGNDLNDLGCFEVVGWPVAVADADPRVIAGARLVLGSPGGGGAVRELAECVLQAASSRTTREAARRDARKRSTS
jgi:N-acylneuraminate cytidylyltransferase